MQADDLYTIAAELLDCAKEALTDAGAEVPARSCVDFGTATVYDDCCKGQITVHVDFTYATTAFPIENQNQVVAPCDNPTVAASYVVTLVRCAPVVDNNGHPPTPQEIDEAARAALIDMLAVRRGVQCCIASLAERPYPLEAIMGRQVPVGPEGGCQGSQTHVTVGLIDPCACA